MTKPKTVRVDDDLWKLFGEKCADAGTFPRHVLEALIIEWMEQSAGQQVKMMKRRAERKAKQRKAT